MALKIGLKLGTDAVHYEPEIRRLHALGAFHYLELFVVKDSFHRHGDFWKNLGIPCVLHAPHSLAGMNPSRPEMFTNNLERIQEVGEFASLLNPLHVIYHSGLDGTVEEAISQINAFKKERLDAFKNALIENKPMVGLNNEKCVGYSKEQLVRIMAETGLFFCLDFGHALCAAVSLKQDGKAFVRSLLDLKPALFHLSDGLKDEERDRHMHLGQGNLDLAWLSGLLPDNAMVTLETQKDSNVLLNDFEADSGFVCSLVS